MDPSNKIEYKIRDLPTRAITLFPDQAQVQRDIKDVSLKPGVNEIAIVGLSPTVNQQSIKVEGSGAATIVGIMVEYIANQERFEDVYPPSDDESPSDSEDSAQESDEPDRGSLLEVKARLVQLGDDLQQAKETIASADQRIKILDAYCNSLNKRDDVDIAKVLATYKEERENASYERMAARAQERTINDAIYHKGKEQKKLLEAQKKLKEKAAKAKEKVQKIKNKKKQQAERRKAQIAQEKSRIRWERLGVWPKDVYKITIQLEVNACFTPGSSRRGSISSEVDLPLRSPSKTMDVDDLISCDLVLSYVTSSAYWTPSYDLQLSTTNGTGSLCFDACLNNMTSETWENCKITLSTSQTSFSGSNEAVPVLRPWRIKMASKGSGSDSKVSSITDSARELIERGMIRDQKRNTPVPPRELMFSNQQPVCPPGVSNHALQDYQMQLMLLEQQNKKRLMMARQEGPNASPPPPEPQQMLGMQHATQAQVQQRAHIQQIQMIQQQQMMQQQQAQFQAQGAQMQAQQQQMQQQQMQQQQMQQQGQQAQQVPPSHLNVFYGGPSTEQPVQQPQGMMPPPPLPQQQLAGIPPAPGVSMDLDSFFEGGTQPQPALDFQESLVEETGLTTTYDLPGHKTLIPKSTATKQRVARVNFSHVTFNHIVLAKYHAAAYLKATLKNLSRWALLKGPGSLTLDGSFMGKVTIPRCSAGDGFTLNLGIDPAIKVLYPKAEVKRSTTGMFSKGDSSEYVRSVTVHNTRATSSKPINLFVFDQVPVSEDERLRVELTSPRGVTLNGPRVPSGAPGRDTPAGKDWGTGNVTLRKLGMLSWEVNLNPGKIVKLGLEYTVSMPVGETAEECAKPT